jgi:hypothetical protein
MFGHKNKEHGVSSISEYFDKKSQLIKKKNRIIRSKINFALGGEHKHLFNKQDVLSLNENARCKVCNLRLAEFRVQKKMENWTPHLKPVHVTVEQPEENKQQG